MKTLSRVLFWLGIISIALSWFMWYFGPEIEIGRQLIADIDDPVLRAVLKEAHGERWAIFIGLWPVTLIVLSYILEKKSLENRG